MPKMTEEYYGGLLGVNDLETDYQLFAGELDLPAPSFIYSGIQYHQPKVNFNSCTVFGAGGTVTDQSGYQFNYDEFKKLWDEAVGLGADPNVGWYLRDAVDLLRKRGSEIIGKKLLSFKVEIASEEFFNALDLGYTVYFGFQGNSLYSNDRKDGKLDGVSFPNPTYGHALRMHKEGNDYMAIVDNYSERTTSPNVYTVNRENIAQLVKNGVFFISGYVFALESDFNKEDLERKIPIWATASAEKAKQKGIITDWSNPEHIIGDDRLEWTLIKLKGLTSRVGNVSLARYAVALDRLGLLD